ncbi:hypothetical protein K488DRAFT_72440 [Vararia minispora EC-137]|uniref:Uncharacterized protein n=1 Tax=Vararia minispora EC-137 TaxID=1314806 RepID=A0ACB8QEP9_9AGAM|nr:hypothetical protein K488DRAFT_72440 [Vararia minispora EC-137]
MTSIEEFLEVNECEYLVPTRHSVPALRDAGTTPLCDGARCGLVGFCTQTTNNCPHYVLGLLALSAASGRVVHFGDIGEKSTASRARAQTVSHRITQQNVCAHSPLSLAAAFYIVSTGDDSSGLCAGTLTHRRSTLRSRKARLRQRMARERRASQGREHLIWLCVDTEETKDTRLMPHTLRGTQSMAHQSSHQCFRVDSVGLRIGFTFFRVERTIEDLQN